jgi:hypothetical protein
VIALFVAIILLSILAEILFWHYWHHFLAEQLALVTGVIGCLILTGAALFIYFKLRGSNHRAYDMLWGTIFAVAVIAAIASLLMLVESLLH